MKLENALFELTTLVDYGTYYLSKKSSLLDELRPSDIVNRTNVPDLIRYLIRDDWSGYILGEIGSYDIGSYVRHNMDASDIVSEMESYDVLSALSSYNIKEYVRDNFDANDIYSSDDMLDCMTVDDILSYLNEDDIKEWVTENCSVDDWACMSWQ